jgi:anti-anti-sigma regulatory factor
LEFAITQDTSQTLIKLSGVIDEDNDLGELTDKVQGDVLIDLDEVTRLNSCGVRDWVNWMQTLAANGAEIVLRSCSAAIVAQINLVNNFTGAGSIESFQMPYFCPDCEDEKTVLCETADVEIEELPPACRCDGCDQVMEFDDLPDAYFAFLTGSNKVRRAERRWNEVSAGVVQKVRPLPPEVRSQLLQPTPVAQAPEETEEVANNPQIPPAQSVRRGPMFYVPLSIAVAAASILAILLSV